ncbi:MAG: tetratricopeptide repeat protein [bacterium]
MNRVKVIIVLLLSVAALSVGLYLAYQFWYSQYFQPPTPDKPKQVQTKPPPDIDISLPRDLKEARQENLKKRKKIFREAVTAHTEGNYGKASRKYRDVIELSGPDRIASLAYRYLGDIYTDDGQFEQAIRLYKFAVKISPEQSEYYYRLAIAQNKHGNIDQARKSFRKALERKQDADYYLALGNLELDNSNFQKAENLYAKGLQQAPSYSKLLINKALAHENQQELQQAAELFKRAQANSLNDSLAYEVATNLGSIHMDLDQYKKAVIQFKKAVSINETVDALYNLALAYRNNRNWTKAVETLSRAHERNPEDLNVLINLGHSHAQLEHYDQAVKYYEDAIQRAPDRRELYWSAARLYERKGNMIEALNYYQKLTRWLKDSPGKRLLQVWRRVGELSYDQGDYSNAAAAFRNALKVNSEQHEIMFNLALTYRKLGKMDKAIKQLNSALKYSRGDTKYRYVLGRTLYDAGYRKRSREEFLNLYRDHKKQVEAAYMVAYIDYTWGDLKRARSRFRSLLDQSISDSLRARIHQNLGIMYARSGKLSEAETSYRQSLALQKNSDAYYNLGIVFLRQGQWDQARNSFKFALERGAKSSRVYAGLGLALYRKGLLNRARTQLERAVELNPNNMRAQYDLKQVKQELESS